MSDRDAETTEKQARKPCHVPHQHWLLSAFEEECCTPTSPFSTLMQTQSIRIDLATQQDIKKATRQSAVHINKGHASYCNLNIINKIEN